MEQDFFRALHISDQRGNVLQVALRLDCFGHVVACRLQLILSLCVLQNLSLLEGFNKAVEDTQRYAVAVGKLRQYRLFLGCRRVLMDHPRAAIAVAYDIVICFEADGRWKDHIKKIFGVDLFLLIRR